MIVIDHEAAMPPFEQIRTQLRAQILAGELIAGTSLPTVRKLAAELRLATNTVARAYKELELSGVIETRGRAGTHVLATADLARTQSHAAAVAYASAMKSLGLSQDEAIDLFRLAYQQT